MAGACVFASDTVVEVSVMQGCLVITAEEGWLNQSPANAGICLSTVQ